MNDPIVSIILPTYNRSEVLDRSIQSVLQQSFICWELIIVDDGSTDSTLDCVNSYSDSRIKYISHADNMGGSVARNTGIIKSSGKYISFIDSDDQWHPKKLELQVNRLENKGESWVACYCGKKNKRKNNIIQQVDKLFSRETGKEGGKELIPLVLARNFSHGGASTLIVKRSIINQIGGFDPSFPRHQDIEFLARVLKKGELAYVDMELVYKYGESSPNIDDVIKSSEMFLTKFQDEIVKYDDSYKITESQHYRLSKHYFRVGKFEKGVYYLLKSSPPHYRDTLGLVYSIYKGLITNKNSN